MIRNNNLEQYVDDDGAVTFLSEGIYHIILSRFLVESQQQFVVAHEFAHIRLDHSNRGGVIGKPVDVITKYEEEEEAREFALEFLAPVKDLIELKLTTPKVIQKETGLPSEEAHWVAGYIKGTREKRWHLWAVAVAGILITALAVWVGWQSAMDSVRTTQTYAPPTPSPMPTPTPTPAYPSMPASLQNVLFYVSASGIVLLLVIAAMLRIKGGTKMKDARAKRIAAKKDKK